MNPFVDISKAPPRLPRASGRASGRGILAVEYDVMLSHPIGLTCSSRERFDSIGDRVAPAEAETFPAADASAGPPYADSTSQRRGMERGFLSV